MTLESLWQLYRTHLHGYDPDAETELEAAFKAGAWCMMRASPKRSDYAAINEEFETLKAKRRDQ